MTGRRLYELMIKKRGRLDVEAWARDNFDAFIVGGERPAQRIREFLEDYPQALDQPPGELAADLARLPGVGPARAATFVAYVLHVSQL